MKCMMTRWPLYSLSRDLLLRIENISYKLKRKDLYLTEKPNIAELLILLGENYRVRST